MTGCLEKLTCLNDVQLAKCLLLTDESVDGSKSLAIFFSVNENMCFNKTHWAPKLQTFIEEQTLAFFDAVGHTNHLFGGYLSNHFTSLNISNDDDGAV